jgi:hypothetical protein
MGDIWPKFFYHESEPEGRKFDCQEDVPQGWVTGPHLVEKIIDVENEQDVEIDLTKPARKPGRPKKEV